MKLCPRCDERYEDDLVFCPIDSSLLEPDPTAGEPPDEPAPATTAGVIGAPPRRAAAPSGPVDTSLVVESMLKALEGKKAHDVGVVMGRMRHLDLFRLYYNAATTFVRELRAKSDQVEYEIDNQDEDERMWVRFTISVGTGKYRRSFPLTVNYYRARGHDVTLEIDLLDIGEDRDQRIFRTEEVGGRVYNTRFGYFFVLQAPRDLRDESTVVEWLNRSFVADFQAAYAAD
jgi:hypothetical protein